MKINNNYIGDAGCKAIINAVSAGKIEQLILINNNITRKGAEDLAAVLPTMRNLQYFYIPSNEIDARGIMKLVEGAQELPEL